MGNGDLGPLINIETEVGAASYQQIAYLSTQYTSATTTMTELANVLGSGGVAKLDLGSGVYINGAGCPMDQGLNTFSACEVFANTLIGLTNGIFGEASTSIPSAGPLVVHTATGYNLNVNQGASAVDMTFENDAGSANTLVYWQASQTIFEDSGVPFFNSDGSGNAVLPRLTGPLIGHGSSAITAGTISGSTTKFLTADGTRPLAIARRLIAPAD